MSAPMSRPAKGHEDEFLEAMTSKAITAYKNGEGFLFGSDHDGTMKEAPLGPVLNPPGEFTSRTLAGLADVASAFANGSVFEASGIEMRILGEQFYPDPKIQLAACFGAETRIDGVHDQHPRIDETEMDRRVLFERIAESVDRHGGFLKPKGEPADRDRETSTLYYERKPNGVCILGHIEEHAILGSEGPRIWHGVIADLDENFQGMRRLQHHNHDEFQVPMEIEGPDGRTHPIDKGLVMQMMVLRADVGPNGFAVFCGDSDPDVLAFEAVRAIGGVAIAVRSANGDKPTAKPVVLHNADWVFDNPRHLTDTIKLFYLEVAEQLGVEADPLVAARRELIEARLEIEMYPSPGPISAPVQYGPATPDPIGINLAPA